MNANEIVSGLLQEFRRGTLILLTLNCLQEPMYGYNLIKVLESNQIDIEANTLYPLMRRLEAQGLLQSEWETSQTKPRKYYQLTPLGREVLDLATKEWHSFANNVNTLLKERQK